MNVFHSIVITGASSGIGAALALEYAGPGVLLALAARDSARLEKVAEDCRRRGATAVVKVLDVSDSNAMSAWLTEVDKRSPIDLVIANAGISPDIENRQLADIPLTHQTMSVNFGGVVNTVLPLLPLMRARGCGHIVVMASLASFAGLPYAATYNASKAAVRVWGESLRHALASEKLGLTVVCPGFVVSRITDRWPDRTPLIMPAHRAARLIRRGVERNKARIAFPIIMRTGLWLACLPPARIMEWLLRKFT